MGMLSISKKKIIAGCGHKTKKIDEVAAFGETANAKFKLPLKNGRHLIVIGALKK